MKIGSVAWGWTPTPEDMPEDDSLLRIADYIKAIGFEIVDYLSDYNSLDKFFTDDKSKEIGKYSRSIGLEVGGLVFQSDIWNQVDETVKQKQLDYFRKCANAAKCIGASAISCIIPGPYGAKPNHTPSPSDKKALNLPPEYNWDRDFGNYAAQMAKACDIAAEYGLKIALECFPGSLCSTPHAMLKALESVNRQNIGIQLDTAHLINQRIDIETAIYMLGGNRIFNVHAKDSDGMTRGNLPCGTGLVDYTSVLRALRNVGYKGNVSIEVEFTANPKRYMRQAFNHLRECMDGIY
ncbi:MAG: sugar phosphate isomerase/epimerase [Oscillospiraceae bacterium]|nr:sugar phosphate isomerase/epimerase [Oscillospiraceae bacterium]